MAPGPVAADPPTVRGRVTSADASPLRGVRVELLPARSYFDVELSLLAGRGAPPSVAVAETDAWGRFVLRAPDTGIFRVVARAPGFVPMRFVLLPLVSSVELPPVTLPRELPARVAVTSAEGSPVAGAAVYGRSASPRRWRRFAQNGWDAASRLAWTDADGAVTLSLLPGEGLSLSVFEPGSAVARRFDDVRGGTLVLEPRPRRRRVVEVRDPRGRAVPGVVVALGDLSWPAGRTGEDGRLVLEAPWDGPLKVHLVTGQGRRSVVEAEPPDGGGDGPLELELPDPVFVRGKVLTAEGRRPLAGAVVWVVADAGRFVRTGPDGTWRLAAPAVPRFRIEAEAPGFLPRAEQIDAAEIPPELLLPLVPASELDGRVVDREGVPLPGVLLEAGAEPPSRRPSAYRPDSVASRAVSGPDGRFKLRRLLSTETYVLSASRPGFTTATVRFDGPGPLESREPLRLVLEEGRRVFGRVVDLEERPLADAEVSLFAASGDREPAAGGPVEDGLRATTDAAGRFEMRRIPAESLDVVARRRGFAPMTVRGVKVPPGEGPVDLGTLMLEPGAAIRGLVTAPDEVPVGGAQVWIVEDLGRPAEVAAASRQADAPDAVAGETGRFVLEDLPPGRGFRLFGDAPGFLPASLTAVAAREPEDVVIVLQVASQVAGRVVDESGQGVPGAEVSLWSPEGPAEAPKILGGRSRAALSTERGEFVLEDVAPGDVEVSAFAEGYQPSGVLALSIAEGHDTTGVEFVLARGATLTGWITAPDGGPVSGAEVRLGRATGRSDAEGRYRVEGLPPGPGPVSVDHPGYGWLSEEVEIEPGTNRADFVLAGGHRVAGRVVDEAELPVSGVTVELRGARARRAREYRAVTGEDGGFVHPRVADGSYGLRAEKVGFVTTRLDTAVTVEGGPAEEIRVVLRQGASITGRILGLPFDELARVRLEATQEDVGSAGEVSYDGRYEIADLAPGDYLVRAWLPGGGRQARARVSLERGVAEVTRDLEFGGGLTLTGQVLYLGEPLPGARVSLYGHDVAGRRQVETDLEGRFRIENLEAGHYRLGAAYRQESLVHNEDVDLTADRDLVVEISTAGVTGRVSSAATSEPLADVLVLLHQLLGTEGEAQGSLFTVGTDSEGLFRQLRLPAGRFRLSVRADGYEGTERILDLSSGSLLEVPEISLVPTEGLDLVVRLASGAVPRRVHLRAVEGGDRFAAARVAETRVPDPRGAVRLATLPAGTWGLLVGAPDAASVFVPARVPGEPLEVVLPPAGELRVRLPALAESDALATLAVFAQDGSPFFGLDPGGELRGEWPVEGGRAVVPAIPAGFWTLRVSAPDGSSWTGTAVTTGGPAIEVRLE